MNRTATSIKGVKLAVSALLAAAAFLALGLAFSNSAKASTVGETVNPEFNYVGLSIGTTIAGEVDSLVLEPPTEAIQINGTYTDTNGNFEVPKEGGLDFPKVEVDLDLLTINGEIELTKDGSGKYNEATGDMDLDLSLSLTLGVDDLAALGQEIGIELGTGALGCRLSPLEVSASTTKGWPHDGYPFADKENLTDGALAGYWRTKPPITATVGEQSVCNIIGNLLQPVGGLWLANDTNGLPGGMPAATEAKPNPPLCSDEGKVGTWPNCRDKDPEVCPDGQTGTPPNCVAVEREAAAAITITKKATVKAGKKVKIKVTVKNTGDKTLNGKIVLSSNKKQVSAAPKSVSVKVAGGKSVTKTITIKASKKAKGKAKITAKIAGKKAVSTITVKAAKKKKKRR